MKLEIGKKYNHRGGGVDKIESIEDVDMFPVRSASGKTYTIDGMYCRASEHPFDLISEYGEPVKIATFQDACAGDKPWRKDYPKCGDAVPAVEYGPWIAWGSMEKPKGLDDRQRMQAIYINGYGKARDDSQTDRDRSVGLHLWAGGTSKNGVTLAYRLVLEPEEIVDYILVTGDNGSRNAKITVKGDDIKAEWVE